MQIELIAALMGYLMGSIPFGLILVRMAGYGDIRDIGSGNIGATNVLRTGNKPLALATLLLDMGKSAVAVIIARYIGGENAALAAGFFAILGHCFPIWLKFKGGKGVATTLGMFIGLAPLVGALTCAIWLFMAFTFRYSSLSALVAVLASPVLAKYLTDDPSIAGLCGIITLLIWFKHRSNIHRLIEGKEPKIGKGK